MLPGLGIFGDDDIFKWIVILTVTMVTILVFYVKNNPKQLFFFGARLQKLFVGVADKTIKLPLSNHAISYIERGRPSQVRPSFLLIHGFSGAKELYLDIISHLPSNYHVIAVDLPGHGQTGVDKNADVNIKFYVENLKKFVDAVGLNQKKFHMAGESMGGHIVGSYSVIYPEDLSSVTMICPHGIDFPEAKEIRDIFSKTGHHPLLPNDMESMQEFMAYLTHKPHWFPNIVLKALLQMRKEKDVFYRKLLKSLIIKEARLLEESLPKIKVPAMLLWGKEDRVLAASCVNTIKSNTPSLKKTFVFENKGHCLTMECPKQVATNLIDFMISTI